ncbi:MAG TPA: RNB domain-containing ribonuclease [Candidatus Angelobacter sp.]|nr:RNB domain-containing ribonuclease [Candidatus Angelobacter sp.]
MITEQQILHYVSRQPKHIAGFKQFVHDLGIKGRDRRHLQQLLREMTHRRKLIAIGKERWGLPTTASNQDLVVGRLRMHRDGYGFVIPEPGSLPARAQGKLQGDIFIPPPEIGNAMHGDQVLVEMGRIRHDGRAEGRIVRVMEREQETVVGIFHYGDRHNDRGPRSAPGLRGSGWNYVTPIDEKVAMEIIIPRGMEYPKAEDEESAPAEDDRDIRSGGSAHTRIAPPPSVVTNYKNRGPQPPGPPERAGFARSGVEPPPAAHGDPKGHTKAPTPAHPDLESPHRVLGSEARRNRTWDDLENVVVEVEITQWPSATQNPRGRVKEILGYEDDFGVDVEMIIRKHHIPHVFPADVLEEAQEISPVIPQKEIAQRADFRHLPIVTIDGETARDFDDAVLVRRLDNGNYELHVHIADVAHYVEDGSAIDEEARKRGTSVYFPDRAVPMLPLELSTDICSLRPDIDRLVLSCVMEINPQGEVIFYDLAEGVIHSAQRMTYTDVNAIIEAGKGHGPQPPAAAHDDQKGSVVQALLPVPDGAHHSQKGFKDRPPGSDHPIGQEIRRRYGALAENFDLMYELAQILNRKRVKRGSIDFDLPEPVIEFDEHGLMKSVTPSERNWAHRLIEEFMLAANETVAAHLEQLGIPSLYRIHEKPDAKRVYEFETIAAGFGYSLSVGALPIKRVQTRGDKRHFRDSGRRAPTIELPEEVHITPRMYQKLVQKITGKPEERVLSFLMLRSLKQARYSEINEGHFALASPTYTHFTSPIRRYPDLIIHRLLKWALHHDRGAQAPGSPERAGFARSGVEVPSAAHKDVDTSFDHPISRSPDHPMSQTASTHESALRFRSASSSEHSPWSKRAEKGSSARRRASTPAMAGPISESELHEIAESSSQTERAADEAERELMEWKKLKFMEQRVGEDFDSLIVSVTKFGFFVELTELFIEGLVPLNSLADDNYAYHDNTRQIIGARSKKTYSIGDKVRVLVDRIDHLQRKIQFAVLEEKPKRAEKRHKKRG